MPENELTAANIQNTLLRLYNELGAWRKVGEKYGLSGATARWIAMGNEPGEKIRKQLGLPPAPPRAVVRPMDGYVPDGTQVIGAKFCACGQWFVPNSGRRKRCFICRPYKGKKK